MENLSRIFRENASLYIIIIIGISARFVSFSTHAYIHPDELYQYQERAFRLIHDYGAISWEYDAGIRAGLIPAFLAIAMALGKISNFLVWPSIVLAKGVWTALILAILLPGAYILGRQSSRFQGFAALFIAAIWYDSILFSVQILTESLAAALYIAGCGALLRALVHKTPASARWAGGFFALAVVARLQCAPMVIVTAGLYARRDIACWRNMALGTLPALALSGAADLIIGQTPFLWAWNNFSANIIENRAASFGSLPPTYYLMEIIFRVGPGIVLLVPAAIYAGRRYYPLHIGLTVHVLLHSLIGHKEFRFIWPALLTLVIVAAIGAAGVARRYLSGHPVVCFMSPRKKLAFAAGAGLLATGLFPWTHPSASFRDMWLATAFANTSLFLVMDVIVPRRLTERSRQRQGQLGRMVCLCALAIFSLEGFMIASFKEPLRHTGESIRAYETAAALPSVCGVTVATLLQNRIGYIYIRRKLPLYFTPLPSLQTPPLIAPTLLDATNAVVVSPAWQPLRGWRKQGCFGRPSDGEQSCLFIRDGGCHASEAANRLLYRAGIASNPSGMVSFR